ncbi:hypothetical protein BKA93DRAFT_28534 [Sparassis latifolia]
MTPVILSILLSHLFLTHILAEVLKYLPRTPGEHASAPNCIECLVGRGNGQEELASRRCHRDSAIQLETRSTQCFHGSQPRKV